MKIQKKVLNQYSIIADKGQRFKDLLKYSELYRSLFDSDEFRTVKLMLDGTVLRYESVHEHPEFTDQQLKEKFTTILINKADMINFEPSEFEKEKKWVNKIVKESVDETLTELMYDEEEW